MKDDASKKAILARRAKFVAAALAGISIAACKDGGPFVCLKIAAPHDADADEAGLSTPSVCLSPPIDPDASRPPPPDAVDAATDATVESVQKDAGINDAGNAAKDAGHAVKHPPPHPTRPQVCLTPVRPKDDKQF